ncbi:unnamed protein product [Notodromas monacha]|uniref:Uncharacterized protein n=1 Tax=Notodromas monacha TaxID=399045 RepID=A0A7R9GH40_9CRUS|nr:unnamed protein product [Notodromas monacha]CAG0922490.1 unnamed protein product [Notodromas monacha]
MHLIAANVCVWMRTIAREGLKDFTRYYVKHSGGPSEDQMILNRVNLSAISTSRQSPDSDSDNSPYGDDGNGQESAGIINNNDDGLINGTVCERLSILGTLRDDTAPYLYPVVVQYSFVAAVVLFVIWLDVGRYPKYAPEAEDSGDVEPQQAPAAAPPPPRQTGPVQTDGDAEAEEEDGPSGPRACAGARKGLVFGLLLVLCAVAATVCYFVLLENAELKMYAIYLADSAHTALLLISLLVVLIGCCRVKKLKFDPHKEDLLNVLLLRVSGFAVLLYATVTIIAAALRFLNPALDVPTLLVLVTAALTVLEIAFQAPFVLDANKRAIHKQTLNETKPGRQLITFLLLTNLAMFAIYIVEAQKVDRLPVQLNFYGYLTWTVILKLVLPLCIFHRFHGAAILAEIWRNSYRTLPE